MPGVIKSSSYEITVGNDTFLQLGRFLSKKYSGNKMVILVDDQTKKHCLPLITERVPALKHAAILEMESGEKNKSLQTCTHLWQQLTDQHADRKTLFVNLGGGVVCD